MGTGAAGDCTAADYAYWWGSANGWGNDAQPGRFQRFVSALPQATWNTTGGQAAGFAALSVAFFQNPDEVTLAVGQGILDSPSALTRQAIAVLCGDPDALAGFVTGYGTFVLGGLITPRLLGSGQRGLLYAAEEASRPPL